MAKVLTAQADDFPRWYQDVLSKAAAGRERPGAGHDGHPAVRLRHLGADAGRVDGRIKAAGAENAYFPLFIPESYLRREADHVEGFSPELAVVTHARRQGARRAHRRAPHQRDGDRRVHGQVGPELPRPAPAAQQLEQRRAVGAAPPAVPAHHRVPVAGGPHRPRQPRGRRRLRHPHPARRVPDFMVDVLAMPVLVGRKTASERFAGRHQHDDVRGHDARRQGAADGHQPRAGAELRQGVRHHATSTPKAATQLLLDDLVGLDDPHGRRADHGPRRRSRPRGAAPAGAHPGGRPARARTRTGRGSGPRPWPPSSRAPGCGSVSTTRSPPASGGAPPTGSSRACPCGSRSAPATWRRVS